MPTIFEDVRILCDGYALRGWQEVNITRSMENAAIAFAMKATNPSWGAEAKALRNGKEIEIKTSPSDGNVVSSPGGGDQMCKGAVDNYAADYGPGKSKEVRIDGRSKARDGIDCPPVKHKTGRIENKDLKEVASELDEFGIGFKTDQKLKKIPKVQIIPGATLFETLEKQARTQGLMLAGDTDGSVNITRAGTKRHAGALVLGQSPVNKIGVKIGTKDKRSPIVVRGQRARGVGKENLRQEHFEYDAGSGIYRPFLVVPEGDHDEDDLKKRAKWQKLRMAGAGISVTATVSRWRDDGGQLWTPGLLMAIRIEPEDIDMDLTLSTVTYRQTIGDDGGTRADLTFVDPRTHGGKKSQGTADQVYDPGSEMDD